MRVFRAKWLKKPARQAESNFEIRQRRLNLETGSRCTTPLGRRSNRKEELPNGGPLVDKAKPNQANSQQSREVET
jgi:hypothetical protein